MEFYKIYVLYPHSDRTREDLIGITSNYLSNCLPDYITVEDIKELDKHYNTEEEAEAAVNMLINYLTTSGNTAAYKITFTILKMYKI